MHLSIIIISYNTKDLLRQCLQSIYDETKKCSFEIIVVDNNSKDGSLEMVKKVFTRVKIIANKENTGYGKANNQGAQIAKGDNLLLLNSDTKIVNNAIDKLYETYSLAEKRIKPEKKLYGCHLLNADSSTQPSAGYSPTLLRVILQMFFLDDLPFIKRFVKPYQQSDVAFYDKEQEVDWVTGAFLLVPSALFHKVGGFDESIFMYGEEVDLCFRLKKNGASVFYTPVSSVYHYKGASSPDGFVAAVVGEYKGLLTFYRKHFPESTFELKIILKIGALLRLGVFGMINPKKVRAYQHALSVIQ